MALLSTLLQANPDEPSVFVLILIVIGSSLLTLFCIRIALRMMGSSLSKASRKPILKRWFNGDNRRR